MKQAIDEDGERVLEVFLEAVRFPATERQRHVTARCSDVPHVGTRVLELLERSEQLGDFLEADAKRSALGDPAALRSLSLLRPGDPLGEFVVGEPLALGGSSVVFRAQQASAGLRTVALKVICVDPHAPLRRLDHCRREAAIALRVRHLGLPAVFGCGHDVERELFFVAMELIEGPTLADRLEERRLAGPGSSPDDVRGVVTLVLQVAEALAVLHAHGIVHRDVSPSNVVLCASEGAQRTRAVLVDFGLARESAIAGRLTRAWTDGYSAPESLGATRADARSDVYALGWLLYDLLARCNHRVRPRDDDGRVLPLQRVSQDLDRSVARLVDCMTSDSRGLRPRNALVVSRVLSRILDGRTGPLVELPWRARQWLALPACRRRLVRMALATTLVLPLGWGVWHWFARDAALRSGNLIAAEQADARLGGFAALLPSADDAEPSLRAARLAIRGGDARSADRIAVRAVMRDGLPKQPGLVRYLAHRLIDEVDSARAEPRTLLPLITRLCIENPATDPASCVAYAPLRETLESMLASGDSVESVGRAASALAACGDVASIPVILAWAERRSRVREHDEVEAARLATVCVAQLSARSEACRFAVPQLSAALTDGCRRLRALLAPWRERDGRIASAWEELELAIARHPILRASMADPVETALGRAAARDHDLRQRLAEFRLDPPLASDATRAQVLTRCNAYGELTGCFDDDALTTIARAQLAAVAHALGLDEGYARGIFDDGLERGRRFRTDPWPFARVDPDSRLGALPTGQVEQELALSRADHEASELATVPHSLAVLDVEYRPARVSGAIANAAIRHTTFDPDPFHPGRGYVRLCAAGSSEITFSFDGGDRAGENQSLRIYAQKGDRSLLPSGGHAALDADCDGRAIARGAIVGGRTGQVLIVPIDHLTSGGEHRLAIRLSPDSETTVRIYSLRVTGQ